MGTRARRVAGAERMLVGRDARGLVEVLLMQEVKEGNGIPQKRLVSGVDTVGNESM